MEPALRARSQGLTLLLTMRGEESTMELMLNVVITMMLVGFPVGLLLSTVDDHSSRLASAAFRHAQHASEPAAVQRAARRRSVAIRASERDDLSGRREAGSRAHRAAASERYGADAA
jgi:hypothetical protein